MVNIDLNQSGRTTMYFQKAKKFFDVSLKPGKALPPKTKPLIKSGVFRLNDTGEAVKIRD